jgi:nucleoid-associated protein YgaU
MHQTGSNGIKAASVPAGRSLVVWLLSTGVTVLLGRATSRVAGTGVTLDAHVATVALTLGTLAAAILTLGTTLLAVGATARAAGRRWHAVEAAAARLTPRLLRRALVVGLGAGLSGLAAPALADTPPALGWQVTEETSTAPGITEEAAAGRTAAGSATAVADVHAAHPAGEPRTVVVRPGDCLWSIAAAHLPAGAADAEIARAWPAWYAANAATIGTDPDLLLPGQRLVVPDGVDA